jgi:hypothetical protein
MQTKLEDKKYAWLKNWCVRKQMALDNINCEV